MKKLILTLLLLIGVFKHASAEVATVVFDYTTAFTNNDFTGYYINSTTKMRKDTNGLLNLPGTVYSLSKKVTVGAREYEVLIEFTKPTQAAYGTDFTMPKNQYSSKEINLKIAGGVEFKMYVRNAAGEIAGDLKYINFYSPQTYRAQILANILNNGTANVSFSNVGTNPPSYKQFKPSSASKPVQEAYLKAGTTAVTGYVMPVEITKIELQFETTDYRPFTPYIEPRGGHIADESNNVYFINNIDVDFKLHHEDVVGAMNMFLYTPASNDNMLNPPREDQYIIQHNHSINISEPTTLWLYAANPKSWSFYSAVNEKIFHKLKANEFETIESLTGISSGKDLPYVNPQERQVVTFSDEILVDGVHETDQGNRFIYIKDRKGGMLRVVSAVDVPFTEGQMLAPRGIAGRYIHNEGTPELDITDFINYCAITDSTASTDGFIETEIRDNRELPEGKPIITDTDYNKHLILKHLTWEDNNYVKDRNGNSFLIYPRFIDTSFPHINIGEEVRIDCYVGKTVRGLTLIPVEINICATPPYVRYKSGNKISGTTPFVFNDDTKVIEWTVEENPELSYACRINGGDWEAPKDITPEMFTGTLPDGRKYCDLEVVANIADEYDVRTSSSEKIRFVREKPIEIASIYDFNHLFLNDDGPIDGKDYSGYYLIKGEVVIEKVSKYNLFVRDNVEASEDRYKGQQYHLILYTPNTWNQPQVTVLVNGKPVSRSLKEGDVITSFVIRPEVTNLGMFRGNSEGFAPTYTLAKNQVAVPETTSRTLEVSYDDPNASTYYTKYKLEPNNRMMLFRFENVQVGKIDNPDYATATLQPDGTKVDKDGNIVDEHIYQMVVGNTLNIQFDAFPDRVGGFIAAYAPEAKYTIEAIVVNDPRSTETGYSMALTDFEGNEQTPAPEKMYVSGFEDIEPDENDIINYTHAGVVKIALPADAPAHTAIYYTTDGTDPKMSHRPVRYDDKIGISLSGDNKQTTVRAFAVEPGSTPSAEITTVFNRRSEELPYIMHLIAHAKPDVPYHYNGNMRIVAIGGDYIFARGAQGNFLPIHREFSSTVSRSRANDRWSTYKVGDYLTDIVFEADIDDDGVLHGAKVTDDHVSYLPKGSQTKPDILKNDIVIEPESAAEAISKVEEKNRLRLVTLYYCQLVKLQSSHGTDEPEWIMIPDHGDAVENAMTLNAAAIGYPMSADLDNEHNYFTVTGFVMIDEEGEHEIWPVSINSVEISDGPVAEFDSNARVVESEDDLTVIFYPATKVTLTYNGKNAANATISYYITDLDEAPDNDGKWNVYGQPFTVSSDCYLHAVVDIPGMATSGHTHVKLLLTKPSADVEFAVSRSGNMSKVALVPAEEIPADSYTVFYSTDGSEPTLEYSEPFSITETTTFLAKLVEKDKLPGRVCKAVISAGSIGGAKGLISFRSLPQPDGSSKIQLFSKEGLAEGTYKIYYTTDPDELPTIDPKMLYTEPFQAPKSGVIHAILVQNNSVQGEVTTMNVWDVTGIDSVESDAAKSVTVSGGTIIAPEGSVIFDVTGRRVGSTNLRPGIYIVRCPGGKSVKVKVK